VRPQALVLRALGLGDLLAGVPALRAIRRALPEHELALVAPRVLHPLARLSASVDTALAAGELEPVPWAGPPPDVAIDLHGNGPESKRLLQVLRPHRLVAFAGRGADGNMVPGPAWDAEEHERTRWCRLVAEVFGVPVDPDDLLLPHPRRSSLAPGAVVVHPGAAAPSRRWPAERFAAVASWARQDGHRVVLTGSASERRAAARVAAMSGIPLDDVLAGRTDLEDLAAVAADASLLVSGDTGVGHLASAFRTPSVLLFGPIPPSSWGPPISGPHTVLWHDLGRGDPHALRPDPALMRIPVEEVVAAMQVRLRQPRASGRRSRAGRRSTEVSRASPAAAEFEEPSPARVAPR
jgi:ADP-heptose:LPS heptosyltransferase